MNKTDSQPRLAYDVHGSSGENVIMIQGLGMDHRGWSAQVPTLAARHKVAVFDNRGLGQSEPVKEWFSVRDLAQDVLRLADEVGFARFHVVGVSFGGMIAQETCLAAPERIGSLTVIASHAGGLGAPIPTWKGLWPFLESSVRNGEAKRRALGRLIFSPVWVASADPALVEARLSLTAQHPSSILMRQAWAAMRHATAQRLPGLATPTLIVRPGMDRLCRPQHSDRLHRLIPHSRLERFDQSGHSVVFEQAEAINRLLLEHIERHAGAQAAA